MTPGTQRIGILLASLAVLWAPAIANAVQFGSGHAWGHCISNSGGTAKIEGCLKSSPGQAISMRYVAGENVFFGPLQIGGQCLEGTAKGSNLVFRPCNGSKAQEWKLTGLTGILNNGQNLCADLPNGTKATGSAIIAWSCGGGTNQTWWNEGTRAKVIAVPGMKSVAVGTKLKVSGGNLIANDGGSIVAAGAGNIVAGGAGNIVAGGAGNIVAGGGDLVFRANHRALTHG